MRRLVLAGAAAGALVLSSLATLAPATAGAGNGDYLTPFRADGATYVANGQVGGTFVKGTYANQQTDANGCVSQNVAGAPAGNPAAYNCLPAGASVVQLANGQVLFWDALENTEGLAFGSLNTTLLDGGRLTVNDESRLLSLDPSGTGGTFTAPGNADGGAHHVSTAEDLPLPAPLAATHYSYNNGSMFCSDQVLLSDGSVLDVGGTNYYSEPSIPGTNKGLIELQGITESRIFSAETSPPSWGSAGSMNHGRWYPALVTLGNGNVFVASGVTKLLKPIYPSHLADSGTNVKQTETYNPATNKWTDNGANATRSLPLFPRLHLLPNGHVYYDAAGQDFNPMGQSYDEALWNIAGTYDPVSNTWHDLGIPGLLTPGINPLFAGFRGSTFSAPLQLLPNADNTYTSASFLSAGGVLLPSPGSYVSVADSRINTVTTNSTGGNEKLTTTPTGPLGRSRWYTAAVPLPDGTVYAVNGADVDEVVSPGMESPIMTAELFTPTLGANGSYSGGSWRDVGQVDRKRTYHNSAILLPDGRVLIGGNAPIPALYNQVLDGISLPGRPGTNNHHDASFQIYEPPYFHSARPVITSVVPEAGHLVIHTPQAATIASVVLMRNTAQTHLVDGDARSVVLPIDDRNTDAGTVTVTLPASTNVLPNGPYLLFANQNSSDVHDAAPGHVVPSIGVQVFAEGTDTAQAPVISVVSPPPPFGSPASKALAGKAIASNTVQAPASALPVAHTVAGSKSSGGSGGSGGSKSSGGSGGSGGSTPGASAPPSYATAPAPTQGASAPQVATLLPAAHTHSDSSVSAWAALGGALLFVVALFGYSGRRRRHQVA
jgi:uncharacterized membrane protein YgcG